MFILSPSTKRTLKTLTLAEKVTVIREVQKGTKRKSEIAADLKNKDKIIQDYSSSQTNQSRKRCREVTNKELDGCVTKWFKQARDKKIPVSGPILQAKAQEFASSLDCSNFKAAFKGEECSSGKPSKVRITVLVGANSYGTEKLPFLTIGKSANPRCFKNVKTKPCEYESKNKAWMTHDIFEKWLLKLDSKFARKKRKVLLFIDNCSAHGLIPELRNIDVVFLPPNTTSVLQPMDQGIINSFKNHYRSILVRDVLNGNATSRFPVAKESVVIAEESLLDERNSMKKKKNIKSSFSSPNPQ
ncbi:tigger transposable element-derived protein 4-like [Belonocnema kinseyi]|uniref:tigger transposable element-derived protein 4-like n=1 Tax=Belonocnema kinseyi TaxID=2817044 RepID=UPI00143D54A4|nr:tigger transposable element-derived protein 4-like [Belonocnema kinseyi]